MQWGVNEEVMLERMADLGKREALRNMIYPRD